MEKRIFILTGSPGIGKTTILSKTIASLKEREIKVGGMLSREVRKDGLRIGFEIQDAAVERTGWLAQIDKMNGPKIGRYTVNLNDLDNIGAKAILEAVEKSEVIAIDEIGPMELLSAIFKGASQKALDSQKLVLAVVHAKAQDRLVVETKRRPDAEVFVVSVENREKLSDIILEEALKFLGGPKK